MVHLNRIATDAEIQATKRLVGGLSKFKFEPVDEEPDDFTATVYGSKYAAEDLPRYEMPVRAPSLLQPALECIGVDGLDGLLMRGF